MRLSCTGLPQNHSSRPTARLRPLVPKPRPRPGKSGVGWSRNQDQVSRLEIGCTRHDAKRYIDAVMLNILCIYSYCCMVFVSLRNLRYCSGEVIWSITDSWSTPGSRGSAGGIADWLCGPEIRRSVQVERCRGHDRRTRSSCVDRLSRRMPPLSAPSCLMIQLPSSRGNTLPWRSAGKTERLRSSKRSWNNVGTRVCHQPNVTVNC